MKHFLPRLFLLSMPALLLSILSLSASAIGNPDDFYDTDTPVDGGIGILVAAGIAYGLKKVRDERKKKNSL
ncbi:MAG: hypothetical protein H7211_05985 [Aquabacterium sp.]|nr:hypothetical protein [Ferruginibacter sp.]